MVLEYTSFGVAGSERWEASATADFIKPSTDGEGIELWDAGLADYGRIYVDTSYLNIVSYGCNIKIESSGGIVFVFDTIDSRSIRPSASGTQDLGLSSRYWREIYCETGIFSKAIRSGTATMTTGASDAVNVADVNILFLDTSGGNITIGGFTGGVNGQVLHVVVIDATGNSTIENIEGGGSQDIYMHKGADETLTAEFGGWTFVCNGTSWFDASHAQHV